MAVFRATLWRHPGKGGWTFVTVPPEHAPPSAPAAFGRIPAVVRVDGVRHETSLWRDRTRGLLLPLSKKVRGALGEGDEVAIEIVSLLLS